MNCYKCGKILDESASFCGGCGTQQNPNSQNINNTKTINSSKPTKSKILTIPKLPKISKISNPLTNFKVSGKSMSTTKFIPNIKKLFILMIAIIVLFIFIPILFSSDKNPDFLLEKDILTQYNGQDYAITIPEKVTEIGSWAFFDNKTIKTITLNDSVKKIGAGAFEGCTSLTMLTIPPNVTEIGDWILAECWSLSTLCVKAGSYADAWAKSYNFHSNVRIEYY